MPELISRRWLPVVLTLRPAPGYQEGVVRFCLDHLNEARKTRHK